MNIITASNDVSSGNPCFLLSAPSWYIQIQIASVKKLLLDLLKSHRGSITFLNESNFVSIFIYVSVNKKNKFRKAFRGKCRESCTGGHVCTFKEGKRVTAGIMLFYVYSFWSRQSIFHQQPLTKKHVVAILAKKSFTIIKEIIPFGERSRDYCFSRCWNFTINML